MRGEQVSTSEHEEIYNLGNILASIIKQDSKKYCKIQNQWTEDSDRNFLCYCVVSF